MTEIDDRSDERTQKSRQACESEQTENEMSGSSLVENVSDTKSGYNTEGQSRKRGCNSETDSVIEVSGNGEHDRRHCTRNDEDRVDRRAEHGDR